MNIEGKYNLELNFPGDGRCFLNFWDYFQGNDVIVEIKDTRLELTIHNEDGTESYTNITFLRYIELVKESINKRTI